MGSHERRYVHVVLLVLVVLAVRSFALPLNAGVGGKPLAGSCNLALVLAFHPMMQSYSPAEGRFFRPLEGSGALAQRIEGSKGKIEAARAALYRLVGEKATITKGYEALRLEFARSKRRSIAAIEEEKRKPEFKSLDPKFLEDSRRVEDDYFRREAELKKQEADVDLRIGKASEDLYSVNFLDPDEQKALVSRIWSDVDAAIDMASERHGVQIVLNNVYTFTAPPPPRTIDPNALPDPEAVTFPRSLYADAVSTLIPKEMELGSFHAKSVTDGLAFRYLDWYGKRGDVLAPFQNSPLNDFLLRGGIDMTPDVLEIVLEHHSIDKQTVSFLGALVRRRFSLEGSLTFKR